MHEVVGIWSFRSHVPLPQHSTKVCLICFEIVIIIFF